MLFKNNSEKMIGPVLLKEGETDCFGKETVIEPDNQVALSYAEVLKADRDNTLERLGSLPDGLGSRLIDAVKKSETMYEVQQKRLLALVRRKVP